MDGQENSTMAYVQAIVDEDEPSRRQGFWTDKSKLTSSHFSNAFRAAWFKGRWVLLAALCWYLWSGGHLHILLVGYEFLCKLLPHIRIGLSTTTFVRNLTSALFGEIPEKGRPRKEPEGFSDKRSGFDGSSCRREETLITEEAVHENDLPSADLVLRMGSQWLQDVPGKPAITRTTVGGDTSTTRTHVGGLTASSTSGKTKANQQSRRSSKRKRQSSREGKKKSSSGSDDEADRNDDLNHGQQGKGPNLPFICPYWKARRGRYQECYKYNLRGISQLKQHLRRKHKAPDWYCFRCQKSLVDEDRYQAHFRADQCVKIARDGPELMRPDTWTQIVKITPRDDPKTWREIYSTLFPDLPVLYDVYKIEGNSECVQHMGNLWSMLSPRTRRLVLADISSYKEQMTESLQETERALTEARQALDCASHSEESITLVGEQTTELSPTDPDFGASYSEESIILPSEQMTGLSLVPPGFDASHGSALNGMGVEAPPSLAALGTGMSEGLDESRPGLFASGIGNLHALHPGPSNQRWNTPGTFIQQLRGSKASVDMLKPSEPISPRLIWEFIEPSFLALHAVHTCTTDPLDTAEDAVQVPIDQDEHMCPE